MKISKRAIVVLALTSIVACGKHSPTAPTTTTGTNTEPGGNTGQQTIEGTIDSIAPPAIVVAGQRIVMDPTATIRSATLPLTFSDLRVGARSRVSALSDGTTLHGSALDVLDDVGTPAQFHGIVSDLARTGDSFQFRIGSRMIRGNNASQVDGQTGALADGATVDVDGLQRSEYAYARRVVVRPADASPSPEPSPSPTPSPSPSPGSGDLNFEGVFGEVSGTCPLVSFPINGQIVITDASTVYVNGSCSGVVAGESAQITATPVGNVVLARKITLK